MLRQIEEKGLRLIVNLHEVAHGEKGVDVFSGNYGCTTKFDVIALHAQLGVRSGLLILARINIVAMTLLFFQSMRFTL